MDETAELEIGIEGHLGVIALNRPKAINALNLDMVLGITRQLEAWRGDDRVRAVLFEGRGPRGFCAGGDVRAARSLVLDHRLSVAVEFFSAEYEMNALIAGYAKPVLAIGHGIVMGGGIGIAGHADFRFCTPDTRFAMPEAAIGFVSDVGVNAILSRAPLHRALAFEMTGTAVGPADALALGLVDCVFHLERGDELREGLIAASAAGDIETSIVNLMQNHSIDPGEATFCLEADLLEEEFSYDRAAEIVPAIAAAAAAYPHLGHVAERLRKGCPTSLETIVQSHLAARLLPDLVQVLAIDQRLARYLAGRGDFAEGVRAVLVDKDSAPRWNPADLADVPRAEISREIINADAAETAFTSGQA